jgi:hypothetical protein
MSLAGEIYYPGDLLRHRAFDEARKQWAVRQVKFVDYDNELGWARVGFGQHLVNDEMVPQVFRVPLSELSRPQPKPPIFEPPAPHKPSNGTIIAPDISPLRATLRAAHEQRAAAQEIVDSASELVARAELNLSEAQRALASVTAHEHQRAEALEASIRNGSATAVLDDDSITLSRERPRIAADTASRVVDRFREELRAAKSRLSERNAQVGTAASRIVVAIYSRVAGELAEAERKAALLRAELRAVDYYITGDLKTTVPNAVAGLLANPALTYSIVVIRPGRARDRRQAALARPGHNPGPGLGASYP